MRDIIVRNFIEVHKDPNHCARWDSDLTETGVSGVEGMAFRIANGCDAPKDDLLEEQVWDVLRSNALDCQIQAFRRTSRLCSESGRQRSAGFKIPHTRQQLASQQLDRIIGLSDDEWRWIEEIPGIDHFSKEHIDQIAASGDVNNKKELFRFVRSIHYIKLSQSAADSMLKTLNDDFKRRGFTREIRGVGVVGESRFHKSSNDKGITIDSLQLALSHFQNPLLNLMLSRQKFSAGQIDKLRHVFTDTPAIFDEMLDMQWDRYRLSPAQRKRIVHIVARKQAVLDHLAESNEQFYAEQVNLILVNDVGN